MKYFLVAILYFFLTPCTFSQQPAFHKFSLESGLPELMKTGNLLENLRLS